MLVAASNDNATTYAVAALVVAALSLVVAAASFAVGWCYQRKQTARRLVVTGTQGFGVMPDRSAGPALLCVGVFNDGLVATTLTNVGFEVKRREGTLQPFEWDHQQPSPLPIRLEPGDTWDGYMVMTELAAREPRGGTIEVRPVATGGGRRFRPRRSWRRPWRTTWREVWNRA